MTLEIFLRYIHFISIFTIVSTLVAEHLLLKPGLPRKEISRLATIDGIYGLAAITLLTAGLTLWLGSVGKPAYFYSKNWIFHLKITLFAVIGLVSIYPTVFFIRNRKGAADEIVNIPRSIFWCLRVELTILFILPLAAEFRGIFRKLADEFGMAFVPFFLAGVAGRREFNLADGLHPSKAGYIVIADHVWPVIRPLL